jgi:hypothetical protein
MNCIHERLTLEVTRLVDATVEHPTQSIFWAYAFVMRGFSGAKHLKQIQFQRGHVSVLTAKRYLGCKQNPVNDRFGCLFAGLGVELHIALNSPFDDRESILCS